ncbi:hypothetical protein THAOC_06875 [Thalassiosira oceanica]|uniref:Uncharacterized protein n=1 Tax=Thalassiosira oceanica TaxID=159749 RepID=K0TLA0_THAOC|nr:hypothetical protein THAOC_06875 [Thalassiosira oceanica]|eukprot:EJK71662.1 hypothetical protein THAOC_06875 [Thalassiosira oceanica]
MTFRRDWRRQGGCRRHSGGCRVSAAVGRSRGGAGPGHTAASPGRKRFPDGRRGLGRHRRREACPPIASMNADADEDDSLLTIPERGWWGGAPTVARRRRERGTTKRPARFKLQKIDKGWNVFGIPPDSTDDDDMTSF